MLFRHDDLKRRRIAEFPATDEFQPDQPHLIVHTSASLTTMITSTTIHCVRSVQHHPDLVRVLLSSQAGMRIPAGHPRASAYSSNGYLQNLRESGVIMLVMANEFANCKEHRTELIGLQCTQPGVSCSFL